MKKVTASILVILYLSLSVGITLHQHYCMGELVGTSLFDLRNEECGKCGMKKHTEASKDCCKDVSIVAKAGDTHTLSQIAYDFAITAIVIPHNFMAVVTLPKGQSKSSYQAHSPPQTYHRLFLKVRDIRI